MKKFKSVLTLSLLAVVMCACLDKDHFNFKNVSDTSWNPKLAVPLLKAEVGVYNLFGVTDSNAVAINGKDISLIYQSEEVGIRIDDIISFEDLKTPKAPLIYTTSDIQGPAIPLDTAFNNIESIEYSAGLLSIHTHNATTNASLFFTFLDILDGQGKPIVVRVTAGGSNTAGLAGKSITPMNNTIRFTVSGSNNGNCEAEIWLTGQDYRSVTGDFTKINSLLPSVKSELFLFKNIASKGNITVSNPILSIKAENSMGFSIQPLFDNVTSINPASGDAKTLIVNYNEIGEIKAGTSTGEVVESEIKLNRDNSNIQDFVSLSPKDINYDIGIRASQNTPLPHKVFKNASCNLKMGIELPLEGRVTSLEILDTIDMAVTNDLTYVKEFLLKTYTDNGFPLDTRITIILMDENRNLMVKEDGSPMELLNEVFTEAASVDADGIVTDNRIVSSEHSLLDEEVLASLTKAKYGQMRASMSTTNGGNDLVKIQSDYTLEVRVGVKITGNVSLTKEK